MVGEGIFAEQVKNLFEISCRKTGINYGKIRLSVDHFNNPYSKQQKLFK